MLIASSTNYNVIDLPCKMEEDSTDKLVEDVKERRYQTTEYALSVEGGAKAVDSIPLSAVGKQESLNVAGLDDLRVYSLCMSILTPRS